MIVASDVKIHCHDQATTDCDSRLNDYKHLDLMRSLYYNDDAFDPDDDMTHECLIDRLPLCFVSVSVVLRVLRVDIVTYGEMALDIQLMGSIL